ncbi:MAG: PilT/PilU family type 4a pilus ATPase [Pseudomonadota bacterium]
MPIAMAHEPDDLVSLLELMVDARASDLHLTTNEIPSLRLHGSIQRISGMSAVPAAWMEHQIASMAGAFDPQEYLSRKSVDFGITHAGHRFRVNLFRHRGGDAAAIRHLGADFSTLAALNLPDEIERFTEYQNGLVLICGATGSGKSTTLASLINTINQNTAQHILTIEDPVEYLHMDQGCIVHQRELNNDTNDFASAVRAALREDPDVILVGEMRDAETMRAALTAAETGHLVFSTLHTGDVVGAVRRLIGAFPANEQDAVRLRVSQSLRAVLAQHLLQTNDGAGRVPAIELMFVTTAIRHLITANKLDQLYSAVETGGGIGMRTLEQSLAQLCRENWISQETALMRCHDTEAFSRLMR